MNAAWAGVFGRAALKRPAPARASAATAAAPACRESKVDRSEKRLRGLLSTVQPPLPHGKVGQARAAAGAVFEAELALVPDGSQRSGRSSRRDRQGVETALLRSGTSLPDVLAALQSFLAGPLVRPLMLVKDEYIASAIVDGSKHGWDFDRELASRFQSKPEQAMLSIVGGLKAFVRDQTAKHATVADRRAVELAVAAVVPEGGGAGTGMVKQYRQLLGVSRRLFDKARSLRRAFDQEHDVKHFRWAERKERGGAIGSGALCALDDFLHSDDGSHQDNDNKDGKMIRPPPGPSGVCMYVKHERRQLLGSAAALWKEFAGNAFWYAKWRAETSNQGSRKTISRAMCPCLTAPGKVAVCACDTCELLKRNLAAFHRHRMQWRAGADGACALCEPGSSCPHFDWSRSTSDMEKILVCPKRLVAGLAMPLVDPATKSELPHNLVPFKAHDEGCTSGECDRCGFGPLYGSTAKATAVDTTVENDPGAEASWRKQYYAASKAEAMDDGTRYKMYAYIKAVRGTTTDPDGTTKPKYVREWVPLMVSRTWYVAMMQGYARAYIRHM